MPDQFTSGVPQWWFGAPLLGVLFGMVANRFFPRVVESLAILIYRGSGNDSGSLAISPETTRFLAPLVGMLVAVSALAAWRLLTLIRRPQ